MQHPEQEKGYEQARVHACVQEERLCGPETHAEAPADEGAEGLSDATVRGVEEPQLFISGVPKRRGRFGEG